MISRQVRRHLARKELKTARHIRDRITDFRRIRAGDLVPNPRNPRVHPKAQADALRALLQEIGYADALLVRELPDGRLMIVDGHLRAETTPDALVPVLVLDVTEQEADKITLTHDPLAAMAETDSERFKALLEIVHNNDPAIEILLRRTAGEQLWQQLYPRPEPPAQFDKADELQKKWKTRSGQLWRIGNHRLLCGDAADVDSVIRLMDGERALLFATDPPYVLGYDGDSHAHNWSNSGVANRKKRAPVSELVANSADIENDEEAGVKLYRDFVGAAIEHAIERNAAWFCWHASRRQRMVESVWNEFGAFAHQQIVWVKSRAVLTHSTYLWKHEPCLFGWIRGNKPKMLRAQVGKEAGEFPTTVWEVDNSEVETDVHPTSKPCKLFAIPMEMHTEPHDICFEPFAGSGSQLVAAEQLGRRCYGIEKSPAFVAVILERMAALGLKPEVIES
jgi:DNA modification methylase